MFKFAIPPSARGDFAEQVGELVLKAVEAIETEHTKRLPSITADPGSGLKRQQQENDYLGAQQEIAESQGRAKALVFRARDILVGTGGGFPGNMHMAAEVSGDSSAKGDTLTITLKFGPAGVAVVEKPKAISGGQAEMISEGLVPSQVSGPQASPAARARIVAHEAGAAAPATLSSPVLAAPATTGRAGAPEVPDDIKKAAGTKGSSSKAGTTSSSAKKAGRK